MDTGLHYPKTVTKYTNHKRWTDAINTTEKIASPLAFIQILGKLLVMIFSLRREGEQ